VGGVNLPRGFESLPLRWVGGVSGPRRRAPDSVAPVRRPVIGLCAAVEDVSYRVWNDAATMLPRAYSVAVQRAEGLAVLLPPDDAAAERPDELLDLLDGILLAGGSDIDPLSYGVPSHPAVTDVSPVRDRFEIALAHRALERDLPLLGICRGMELLNVATGGTLVPHLPDVLGSDRHRREPGVFCEHGVRLEAGSLAAEAVGAERTVVKSHHHQGAGELGEGLAATGYSDEDDIVEAIEVPERRFALGVLWHPEVDARSRVMGAFVGAARAGARASLSANPLPRAAARDARGAAPPA
jgi:putative glutamine amidotransferase